MSHVCLMYVLCMSHVCLMYVSCMSYVCLMYMFHLTEANTDEKADSEHGTDCKTEADSVDKENADSGTGEKAEAKANNDEEPKTKKSGAGKTKAAKATVLYIMVCLISPLSFLEYDRVVLQLCAHEKNYLQGPIAKRTSDEECCRQG